MLLMTRDHEEEDNGEKGEDDDDEDSEEQEGFYLLTGGRLRWEDLASAPLSAWDDDDNRSVDVDDKGLQGDDNYDGVAQAADVPSRSNRPLDSSITTTTESSSSSAEAAAAEASAASASSGPQGTRKVARPAADVFADAQQGARQDDPAIHTNDDDDGDDDRDSFMYSLAHGFERSGSSRGYGGRTAATTVNVADIPHKGRGLVAGTSMPRGTILYTERAAVACQVMSPSRTSSSTRCTTNGIIGNGDGGNQARGSEDGDEAHHAEFDGLYDVRACQHCFRSLEPCLNGLPHPELWPTVAGSTASSSSSAGDARAWPAQCPDGCESWFCSMTCHQQHREQYGSCCDLRHAARLLLHSSNGEDGVDLSAEPAIALAVRMLRHCLHQHRQRQSVEAMSEKTNDDPAQSALDGTALQGLCGDPADVTPLELGFPDAAHDPALTSESLDLLQHNRRDPGLDSENAANDDATSTQQSAVPPIPTMTLEPLYRRLVELWSMSPHEASVLHVRLFHTLAAMAARNGVGMSPASPFATYYQALIRHAGGRGTPRHAQVVERVAIAVSNGATDRLERGMDRHVQQKVSPSVVAVYPLTSRINHDCRPSAELVCGFVDCHVDVRLLRNVDAGEEITINYVGRFGNRNKSLECRQTELRRKYLFNCRCRLCLVESGE
jgi:SET domain